MERPWVTHFHLTFCWKPLYVHSSGIQETEAGIHILDLVGSRGQLTVRLKTKGRTQKECDDARHSTRPNASGVSTWGRGCRGLGGISVITHKAHHCVVTNRPSAQPRAPGCMPYWMECVATYTPWGCWLPRHVTNTHCWLLTMNTYAHTQTHTDVCAEFEIKSKWETTLYRVAWPVHPKAFHNIINRWYCLPTGVRLQKVCTETAVIWGKNFYISSQRQTGGSISMVAHRQWPSEGSVMTMSKVKALCFSPVYPKVQVQDESGRHRWFMGCNSPQFAFSLWMLAYSVLCSHCLLLFFKVKVSRISGGQNKLYCILWLY